jgi:uncharacterized repeat protein (TIGR03833 family)
MNDKPDGRYRSSVRVGATVEIVRKQDQGTGKKMRGIVAEILTNASFHPHGIKVRLMDGTVGRVATIVDDRGEMP